MSAEGTIKALAAMTDQGLFERLATAILREANPAYQSLVHPGVNVAGKTVKSPLDGICFVPGANPPHMIAVHHTTTAAHGLEEKWLHDPANVKPRKGSRPSAPAGDLIKTAELVNEERKRTQNLRATLVLTTNEEPDEALVRAVEAAGRHHGLEIDLWPRSRLGHFLDNKPAGQWIRHSFLGTQQEMLLPELLRELSMKSLEIYRPPDDPKAWVRRALDDTLATALRPNVTFLVAGSGLGKSVACYRKLAANVEGGGFGIVLPHEAIASAMTLEQAVMTTLRALHPPLAAVSSSAFSFCSPERPLFLVVEDINRSGQPQLLAEKLAGWTHVPKQDDKITPSSWRLVCPLWPEVVASMGDQTRKRIEPLMIVANGFSESEGAEAVLARARLGRREMSGLDAHTISRALGNDPLLIALHNLGTAPQPHHTISQFVEGSLSRVAAMTPEFPAAEYRQALRALAGEMLANRQIELKWRKVSRWARLQGKDLGLLGRLAHHGELIRLTGRSDDQSLSFRHDRVRDWILTDAAAELERQDLLSEQIIAEPYFAEVMGALLVWGQPRATFLQHIASSSPLALFHAFRLFGEAIQPEHESVLQAINDWLGNPATHDPCNLHLRLEALAMLAETDSPRVLGIVSKFRDQCRSRELAMLRNGDISGGIELCISIDPGFLGRWGDTRIQHAKLRHGGVLTRSLDAFLRRTDLASEARIGALRLAGLFADPSLALAIEACWIADGQRGEYLGDYLWAFAECCADDPARFLGPVCDAWAALPAEQSAGKVRYSPRTELVANELRWAFHRRPPLSAMDYLVQRGSKEDLKWPIICMFDGMDHPKAVLFVVNQFANTWRHKKATNLFSRFRIHEWRCGQDYRARPMSKESRDLLLGLWREEKNDMYLRSSAFGLWAATIDDADTKVLRATNPTGEFADAILLQRLERGDQQAIPALIEKLDTDEHEYWWQFARHIWSPELTEALGKSLARRCARAERSWGSYYLQDYFTAEMIMKLPESEAERLLLKHWEDLRFRGYYVQAAIYIASPLLMQAVRETMDECPEPAKLLVHLSMHFGLCSGETRSLIREAQVLGLAPYLHLLSPSDIERLWEACNDHGWFTTRRKLLDHRLQSPYPDEKWDPGNAWLLLDKVVPENRLARIGHWIDDFLKTDVSWGEILGTMTAWLESRRSFEALRVVAAAVEQRGTRGDLDALKTYKGMPEAAAKQLIADTQFAVRRRSLG